MYTSSVFVDEFSAQGLYLKSHQRCSAGFLQTSQVLLHGLTTDCAEPVRDHLEWDRCGAEIWLPVRLWLLCFSLPPNKMWHDGPYYWLWLIQIIAIWSNNCDQAIVTGLITFIWFLWIQGQNWHTLYSLASLFESIRLQKAMTDQSESGIPESCVITTICCYTNLVLTNKQRPTNHA